MENGGQDQGRGADVSAIDIQDKIPLEKAFFWNRA
jgi:hypothetical protein